MKYFKESIMKIEILKTDLLIIGGGLAGLSTAITVRGLLKI
jgi:succinate dehydrogenase/fumarate reductase flavoprotein subunit